MPVGQSLCDLELKKYPGDSLTVWNGSGAFLKIPFSKASGQSDTKTQ